MSLNKVREKLGYGSGKDEIGGEEKVPNLNFK